MSAYDSLIAPAAAHSRPSPRHLSCARTFYYSLLTRINILLLIVFNVFKQPGSEEHYDSVSSYVEYFRSIVKVQMTKSRCNMTKWQRTVWEDIMIGLFLLQICLPAVPAGDTVTGKLEYLHKCKNRGWYHFWESTPGSLYFNSLL